ncbi:MAG: protein FdrA [Acidimicrobiales bacterium]
MSTAVKLFKDTYLDSVLQLSGTRAMSQAEDVTWAAAAMATPANLDVLREKGFRDEVPEAHANDLFLAVLAGSAKAAGAALEAGEAALFSHRPSGTATRGTATRGTGTRGTGTRGTGASGTDGSDGIALARSLADSLARLEGAANVAIVSVPGPYAALEAHKALTAGLHVLLFSDNVSLQEEVELKDRARALGRLVMGPGAGTAMLAGTGLGFANVVRPGRVGVVAAAGTGAQEAMSLLDQWGAGVSHVIGLGGRDLSRQVAGRMAISAIEALQADAGTDAILLVSKPPAPEVAQAVLSVPGAKALVAALIGLAPADAPADAPAAAVTAATLEEGVTAVMASLGLIAPDPTEGLLAPVDAACDRLGGDRSLIRGLFSGGTLCYEALSLLYGLVGPVYSNTPIDKRWGLPAPDSAHTCLDLGEEEYTKGRPHPMIDHEARIELMRQAGHEPEVAVVLIDVVLGYGSHPDPAGLLAPVAREIRAGGAGPEVVAYVLGTEADPQGLAAQRAKMRDSGCIVPATAARAALTAAALATRQPQLVLSTPAPARNEIPVSGY